MAVNNKLVKTEAKKNVVEFEANGMKVSLTPEIVRNYLVSGDKERVSINELAMFMNLCKYNNLNPWTKEAYCIKYGNEPATMVIGKDAFLKRAESNKEYDGNVSGIIVSTETGELDYRTGTLKLPGDEIVGGFAEVWRKDRSHSTRVEVSFEEYAGRKRDGSLNGQWSKKPATMIRKVALVQALREAFPNSVGGMNTADEIGIDEPNEAPVEQVVDVDVKEPAPAAIEEKAETTEDAPEQDVAGALFG